MIDTFVDKLSMILASEVNKRLSEICEKLPELLENRDNVTLWEQEIKTGYVNGMKYSVEYCGEERAYFCTGLSKDEKGVLQIIASDVVYL